MAILNAASATYGTILKFGSDVILDITSLSPSVDVNEVEVTNINSSDGFQEFIPTTKGMEISFDFNYSPANTGGHTAEFFDAITASPITIESTITIEWKTNPTVTWTFAGFIRNVSIDGSTDGALTGSGTIRVTGVIDFST